MTFKVSNNLAMLAMLMTGLHDANAEDPDNHVEMVMGNIYAGESVHVTATKSKYLIELRLEQGLDALLRVEYWQETDLGHELYYAIDVDCNNPDTWVEPMICLQNVLDGKMEPGDPLEE